MIKDGLNKQQNSEILSFLIIGQSNMAGRGDISQVEPIKNPDCLMLRMGRWQPMSEPVNPDRSIFSGRYRSGICLAASFADEAQRAFGKPIGLIPSADGGTTISQWLPGELLFDHAVMTARLAMRTSQLSGILWHQGESDCNNDESLYAHKETFIKVMSELRIALSHPSLPIVIGELSENYNPSWHLLDRPVTMNERYREASELLGNCAVASSKRLTLKDDGIHFDSPSLREFGRRYFEAYKTLI